MNTPLRVLAIWIILALVIHAPGLSAQTSQTETGLARIDAASRSMTNGLVQTLRNLPRQNEKYRLQIGNFALVGQQVALGSLWANNLATFLASAAAAPGANIVLSLQDGSLPDYLVQGELVSAGDTIRIYTRLVRMEDRTVLRGVWSDLAMDSVLAGLIVPAETTAGQGHDMYEPDSQHTPLAVIPGAAPIERTLHDADEDWFVIQATTSGILVVETTGDMDTLMSLYKPGSSEAFQEDDDSGDGGNARMEYPIATGQTVLVSVSGYDGETGQYSFSVVLEPLSSLAGQNDTRERALPLALDGESRRQILGGEENTNWFSLTIPEAGGVLLVKTTGSLDMLMELHDAQGRKLAEDDDSGDGGNALISMALPAGQYFIKLYEYESNRGIYQLEAKLVSMGPPDQYEPDDSREEAKPISLGSPQRRTFNHPGDIDWAVMDLSLTSTYGISARPPRDNGLDTYIELYDEAGLLLGEDDDGGRNMDAYLEIKLTAGRYYIKVWQLDPEVPGGGSYELLVRIP
jgi:hypothetical protein